ncbi:MAG: imidazole glycerol phosphate synthase subunit HisH [Myxococcales bacterium]|nr:imidazole glycerol phosphate synthase subunit HisH [Myxococcales bacterium]
MKASLFDYGAGNLHSLERALTRLGVDVSISTDPLVQTDLLVLPGVGAFGLAADRLAPARSALRTAISAGRPVLGICLGMQLLFDSSEEDASTPGRGLSLLEGTVTKLKTRRVPHIGWTRLEETKAAMYFAHSFACRPADPSLVTAWARHDDERFPAAVRSGRIAGVQFHPEKSSSDGLALLESLVREVTS